MKDLNWEVISSEHLIKKKWISIRADKCKMPSGKIIDPFYVYEFPNWVTVVAITKNKEVVLVRQYRHGCGKSILELPAGVIDETDLSPLEAAKRELIEETGYTSDEFIQTCIVSANPSTHNNVTFCFLATNVELTEETNLDDTEEIEVVLKPLDEVIEALKNNEFLQSLHVSALFQALIHLNKIDLK